MNKLDCHLCRRDGQALRHVTRMAEVADCGDPSLRDLRVGGHFRWSNEDAFVRLIEQVFPVRSEDRGAELVLRAQRAAAR